MNIYKTEAVSMSFDDAKKLVNILKKCSIKFPDVYNPLKEMINGSIEYSKSRYNDIDSVSFLTSDIINCHAAINEYIDGSYIVGQMEFGNDFYVISRISNILGIPTPNNIMKNSAIHYMGSERSI